TSINRGGPAQKAGIQHGDKILAINNKPLAGTRLSSKKVVDQIRGRKGTPVVLTIKRDSVQKKFSVMRDQIVISSIDAAYMLNEQSGYVKISKFGAKTD